MQISPLQLVPGPCHSRGCPVAALRQPGPARLACAADCHRQSRKARQRLEVTASQPSDTAEAAPPSTSDDSAVDAYRPRSPQSIVLDAARSVQAAIADGVRRMEVEYPPLTGEGFEASFKSSDEYIDTNVQLALSAANRLRESSSLKIHILVPDKGEYQRSYGMFKNAFERTDGQVTMGYLLEGKKGLFAGFQPFSGGQGQAPVEPSESAKAADVFIGINITSADLPALERYTQDYVKDRSLILWNLELDTLRSDLGLIGFPKKDLQYRFLSSFKPVFYIRPREYSKSIAAPPFVVNYGGCLFRAYPGPWQCMLKEPDGLMVSVAERDERFDLGELKDELLTAMGLNTEAQGSALAFLRRGYKTSTWWEDARELEKYADWRT